MKISHPVVFASGLLRGMEWLMRELARIGRLELDAWEILAPHHRVAVT